jgi:hypothetical protein
MNKRPKQKRLEPLITYVKIADGPNGGFLVPSNIAPRIRAALKVMAWKPLKADVR